MEKKTSWSEMSQEHRSGLIQTELHVCSSSSPWTVANVWIRGGVAHGHPAVPCREAHREFCPGLIGNSDITVWEINLGENGDFKFKSLLASKEPLTLPLTLGGISVSVEPSISWMHSSSPASETLCSFQSQRELNPIVQAAPTKATN